MSIRLFATSILATALVAGAAAGSASAEVLAVATSLDVQNFGFTPDKVLDLNGPLPFGTSIPFTVTTPSRVIVSFDAECSVGGPGSANFVNLDIVLQPAPAGVPGGVLPPTNSADAFCTSNGTLANDGWVTASRSVFAAVPAGTYSVRIVARTSANNGFLGQLGDMSLIVSR